MHQHNCTPTWSGGFTLQLPHGRKLSCQRCPLNCGPNCKFGKRQLAGQAKFAQKEINFLHKKGQLFVQKMARFWAPKMDPFLCPQMRSQYKYNKQAEPWPQNWAPKNIKNGTAKRAKITSCQHHPVLCRSSPCHSRSVACEWDADVH